MYCRDFKHIAGDLAAGHMMEAGKRERAFRHAAECAECSAWLNAEKALDAGLRAYAESDQNREASAALKPSLRAAFDQRFERQTKDASILTFASTRAHSARNWERWGIAAAALIFFAIAIAYLSYNKTQDPNKLSSGAAPASSPTPAVHEQSPIPVIEPDHSDIKSPNASQKKFFAISDFA